MIDYVAVMPTVDLSLIINLCVIIVFSCYYKKICDCVHGVNVSSLLDINVLMDVSVSLIINTLFRLQ